MRPQRGKQKLLDAATRLFASQGYFATTVEQITEEAGVSKGLVYNYFSSKEALLTALIDSATNRMTLVAEALDPTISIEQSITQFLDRFLSFLEAEREFLKLQLTLMLMPELQQVVRDSQQRRAELLLATVTGWFRRAEVRQPSEKARLFLAMIDGVALHYLCIYDDYPLRTLKPQLARTARNLCNASN